MMRDRSSQAQIKQERYEYFKSEGICQIRPMKGQTEDQIYNDIKCNISEIKELMAEQSEINKKKKQEQNKLAKEKKLKKMKENMAGLIAKKQAGKI